MWEMKHEILPGDLKYKLSSLADSSPEKSWRVWVVLHGPQNRIFSYARAGMTFLDLSNDILRMDSAIDCK
jgi:phage terminase large subunit-like protein